MNTQALERALITLIQNNEPALLVGPPGVGKTDIVKAAAHKSKADLIIFHPVVSDPTDFKGLPGIVDGHAEFLPYGDLRKLIEADTLTVCFLDDLGQAPQSVQAAAMQLLLAREINGKKISDKVVFVAATNRREDKAGVSGILEPLKSRFTTILNVEPSVDDWSTWALSNGVPPEVVAFIRFRPALLTQPGPATQEIKNRTSPRTIAALGRLWKAGLSDHEILSGAAGEGCATEFLAFIRIWQSLPNIDAILLNPKTSPVPTEVAILYAVATALAIRATSQNAGRVIQYLDRLPEEFSVLGVRDLLRQCPGAANNSDFVKWASKHADVLV